MGAARRAAAFLALADEPALASYALDASALDAFCRLSVGLERARASDAALGAACADSDEHIAAVARVMVQVRAMVRGPAAAPPCSRSPVPPPARGAVAAASFERALEIAKDEGVDSVEVPREFLKAIGVDAEAVRLLRAAFSKDDEAAIRALADDFDIAELQGAVRLSASKSLRAGLRTAGAAFRGVESRERALQWASRLENVRRCGRKRRGALSAAVEAAGSADGPLAREAVAADAVWDSVERAPAVTVRMALLCDSVMTHRAEGFPPLAPIGNGEPDASIVGVEFGGQPNTVVDVDAFASAIDFDRDVLDVRRLDVRQSVHESASAWLAAAQPSAVTYAWPLAEPSERILAPAMTFSASRLNLYVKCPRRWYYEYLCAAVEETTTANAVYGKVFHAALESLHRDVRVPSRWDRAEVLDRLCSHLDTAFGAAHGEFACQLEYEVLRLRARRVAQQYVRWLYEESADAPLEIVEIESRQTLLLGGHRFVGYIDRIDRPAGGGPITIFDYKTGRIEDDPEAYLRAVRSGEEAQLALYYAMRRAQGDDVARVALVSIRDAREKTWILALDITDESGTSVVHRADRAGVVRATVSSEDLERSLDLLTARCDLVTREGVGHFDVGADPPCSHCAYALACRERPADEERIFAR